MSRLCLACAWLSAAAFAQTNTAVIRGSVTDPAGANVPNARIAARNEATGVAYSAETNDSGLYLITEVPGGIYQVTVTHPGFQNEARGHVEVSTGQAISLDFRLKVGDMTETVTVTTEVPLVESATSGLDQLIESRSIANIPLGDRRTMNVIQLSGAAVFAGYDSGQKPNFSLAGGRAQSQMFWIDGASGQNMRLGIGQIDTDPPTELVEEIKVLSNNYSAEFGGSNGGVIVETTKSGTNQLHGSALEYLRNDAMDAPGFFAPVQNGSKVKPELRYNLFGGTLGGPVRKNRTFFFFDYEGGRRRTGYTATMTVPTPAQRTGDFSATTNSAGALIPIYDPSTTTLSGSTYVRQPFPENRIPAISLDPVALKVLAYYPLPNRPPDNPTGANNFRANGVNTLLHDFWSIKGDQIFGKDRITGRFMYNRDNTNVISAFPDPGPDPTVLNIAHQKSGLGDWVHTITPSAVNDFRINISSRVAHALTAGVGGDYAAKLGLNGVSGNAFPNFQVSGFSPLGSTNQERRQYPIEQQQAVENLSSLRGQHSLKAGFEVRRSRNYEVNLQTGSGSFGFNTQPTGLPGSPATGSGLASLLVGFPSAYSSVQTEPLDRHSYYLAGFVQDDWTVSRVLTLNLGLRWETDTPITDANGRMNGFDQTAINPVSGTPGVVKFMGVNGFRTQPYNGNWKNFGPRIGFAWKAGGEGTVVRGGFGIFYAHPFDAGVPNAVALGFSQSIQLNSPDNGITAPFYLRNGVPNVSATQPGLNDAFGAVPVGQNPNTAVTFFETNRKTGYSEEFNLGVQRQVGGAMVIEASAIGNLARRLPSANLPMDQISPAILGPAHQSQRDRPFPQFSNVSIQGPSLGVSNYYAGLLRAERRFSHGLNFNASYTFSKFLENTNDPGTTIGSDAGPYSNFYNRRADYGPSANDVRHRVSAGVVYELPFGRGRAFLTKGALARIAGGWTVGNVTIIQSGPPMSVTTQTNNTNSFSAGAQRPDVSRNPNLPADQRTLLRWFDTGAFAQPANFTFGDSGRNIVRAPGLFTMDFSIIRDFAIAEHVHLEARGESFNALNHTNFSAPGGVFGGSGFGTISGSAPARVIQAGMRLAF
ncbi:MAG TPA: carboxypeptidase regulatory-like domain-containing protein [Bryobacteraceae bacterium]|jgi:hypothetical protein|nr:carboxypeptidase regulatory-like domain-containing protein [Bryobacteraceae bacterium]